MAENQLFLYPEGQRALQCGNLADKIIGYARDLHEIGVPVAVRVHSSAGRVYQEGLPSMQHVMERVGYERGDEPPLVKFRRSHAQLNEVVSVADAEQLTVLEILAAQALQTLDDALVQQGG